MTAPAATAGSGTDAGPAVDGNTTTTTGQTYTPPATQADFDKIIGERVNRTKAQYADYNDLKAKAAKLAEIEAANLTEAEKAQKRITDAEAKVAALPAQSAAHLRDALVTLGVVPEARKVLLTATDPETLIAQVKAIQELETSSTSGGRRSPHHVPREGTNPTAPEDAARQAVRGLFGSG